MYVIHAIRTFVLPIQEDQYDDEALQSAGGRVTEGANNRPCLEQRNLRRGTSALESQPVARTRREQAHGPTFPKAEREREDVARQVGQFLQRERGEGVGRGR
jgi:hypothetical protein